MSHKGAAVKNIEGFSYLMVSFIIEMYGSSNKLKIEIQRDIL